MCQNQSNQKYKAESRQPYCLIPDAFLLLTCPLSISAHIEAVGRTVGFCAVLMPLVLANGFVVVSRAHRALSVRDML